jgi:tRNA-2-methylthio-N6-dimethylallyladenosine synthase
MSQPRKVFIKSYGCQMNVYDAERMADALAPAGYISTMTPEDADLILLNTCHIREKASEKVYSELGRLRLLKQARQVEGKRTTIGVAGCVAQAEGKEMIARAPVIDLVVGPQSYHHLPTMLEDVQKGQKPVNTDFPVEDKFDHIAPTAPKIIAAKGPSAFLTIQEGCDKFCTFCVVPYTRGAEVSRPVSKIMHEARHLVASGVKEITLLGQNVNAYHGQDGDGAPWSLAQLLYALADIEGLERLRYTTSHPRDMDDALINAHADLPQLMPYLHLPVQSGSNRILKAMNRHHTREDYLKIMDAMRKARPDVALSGDFIVGFPGESDGDFEDTIDLIRQVGYAQAFSFCYSPRPGTPGSLMDDQIEQSVKSERLQRLQALLRQQQNDFMASKIGTTMDILLEKKGKYDNQLVGRSPWLQPVNVTTKSHKIGELIPVTITKTGPNSLFGDTLADETKAGANDGGSDQSRVKSSVESQHHASTMEITV